MIAERDRVDTGGQHLGRELRCDPDAVREILAVQDGEVGVQLVAQCRETLLHGPPAGNADGVCNEQDSQGKRLAAARSSMATWFPASCV